MLSDVEAGETFLVTRHNREIARIVPLATGPALSRRKRAGGSRLARLPRRELHTAADVDELLADERDR